MESQVFISNDKRMKKLLLYCLGICFLSLNAYAQSCEGVPCIANPNILQEDLIECTQAALSDSLGTWYCPESECFDVCENTSNDYSTPYNAGSVYEWDINGGVIVSTTPLGNAVTVLWESGESGTLSVKETDANGCDKQDVLCINIKASPQPSIASLPNANVFCKDVPIQFAAMDLNPTTLSQESACFYDGEQWPFNTDSSQYAYSMHYFWDFGDGTTSTLSNPTHSFTTAGVYTITLTMSNNCQCFNTTTIEVEITNDVGPQVISCLGALCEGDTAQYCTDALMPNWTLEGGVLYASSSTDNCVNVIWNNNDNTLHDGEGMLIVSDLTTSCGSGETYYPVPVLSASPQIVGKTIVCPNTYELYSYAAVPGVEYAWVVTGGTVVGGQNTSEIKVEWNNQWSGQVLLNLSSTTIDCNLGQTFIDVDVLPTIYVSGSDEACADGLTVFSDAWLTNTLEWSVVNGSIIDPVNAPFVTDQIEVAWDQGAGSASVHAVATQAGVFCESSTSFLVEVKEQPQKASSINGDSIICPGASYLYTVSESNASSSDNLQYQWSVVGGVASPTEGESVMISWNPIGPYSISVINQLQTAPNCESEELIKIVNPISMQNPIINGNATACLNTISTYALTTNYPDWATINWSFNNPILGSVVAGQGTSQVQIEWGNQIGAVEVVVEVEVCGQIYSESFPVTFIDQSVSFAVPDDPICSETPFSLTATAGVGDYFWNFGDNTSSSQPSPVKSYDDPGTYLVDLTFVDASTSCASEYSATINVEGIAGQLLPEGSTEFCSSANISQSLYITTLSTATPTIEWLQNGNLVSSTSSYTVTSTPPNQDGIGNYTVVLTDANGCSNTLNTISIDTIDCSNGSAWCIGGEGCPEMIPLSYTSACNQGLGTTTYDFDAPNGSIVEWRVGNGPVTSGVNYSYTFNEAGVFNIKIRESGCVIAAEELTIPLVVDIDYSVICDPTNGNQMTYYFQDNSSYLIGYGAATYLWDFGDGTTSTEQNPSHVYAADGNYDISLSIDYGGFSCSRSSSLVVAAFNANYSYAGLECENYPSISFAEDPSSTDIANWSWTFGDGASSNRANPQRTYGAPGTYTTTLMLVDVSGCTATTNQLVTIEQTPSIDAINTVGPFCANDAAVDLSTLISFTAFNGETIAWSGAGVEQDPLTSAYYFNPMLSGGGSHEVCATITDDNGCLDTECVIMDVICPEKPKIFGESTFCNDNSYHYYTTQNTYSNYQWYLNGVATTTTTYGYYFYGNTTTDLTVEFTDENGCTTMSEPFTVTVNPLPNTFSANTIGSMCPEQDITLIHTGNENDVHYYWNTPEKHTESTITILSESNYNYYAVATNEYGCERNSNTISLHQAPNMGTVLSGCYCDSTLLNAANLINISGVSDNGSYTTEWLKDAASMTPAVYSNNLQLDPTDPNYLNLVPATFNQQLTDAYGCEYYSENLYLETNCMNCFTPFYMDTTVYVCDQYSWYGEEYVNSGTYEFISEMANGCDSVTSLYLTVTGFPEAEITQGGMVLSATEGEGLNYVWNTGETTQSIVPAEEGEYWVYMTTMYGCVSDTFYYAYESPLSLAENYEIEMELYPNPSKDVFYLTVYEENSPAITIQLMNVLGDLLFKKELLSNTGVYETSIDLAPEPKGVYFLQIITNKGSTSRKLILQ